MPPITFLDSELEELNAEIARLDSEAEHKQKAVAELLADMRASGTNPALDKDAFAQVDALQMEASAVEAEAVEARARRDRAISRLPSGSGHSGPSRSSSGWAGAVAKLRESPRYQELLESGAFTGTKGRIDLPGVSVLSRDEVVAMLQSGAIGHAVADVGAIVAPDQRLFPPVPIPVRTPRVSQLVTVTTTDSDQVDYVEETTRTDAAAETALGEDYPEATYVYTAKTASVKDIGHNTPAHRRNLADEGQIRGLLTGRLQSGVERRLDSQMIVGTGTGENLRGILETEGIGTVSIASEPASILKALHRGITTVRIALEDEPTAIGIHPNDYQATVFESDNQGQFLLSAAAGKTSQSIWGLPTIVSTVFPESNPLVGAWAEAMLWIRDGISLAASDSHEDFFTKRMVMLQAEMRAAFAAVQPRAFCEIIL